MCEYCGCRQIAPIGELMDEHTALVDQATYVRKDLGAGNHAGARARLAHLIARLDRHVAREEAGIFRAMRATGEFTDEIDELEGEHHAFATAIAALDPDSPDFATRVTALLDDLEIHVERQDLGIFPVSVVTLGGDRLGDRGRGPHQVAEFPARCSDDDTDPHLRADHAPARNKENPCRGSR